MHHRTLESSIQLPSKTAVTDVTINLDEFDAEGIPPMRKYFSPDRPDKFRKKLLCSVPELTASSLGPTTWECLWGLGVSLTRGGEVLYLFFLFYLSLTLHLDRGRGKRKPLGVTVLQALSPSDNKPGSKANEQFHHQKLLARQFKIQYL